MKQNSKIKNSDKYKKELVWSEDSGDEGLDKASVIRKDDSIYGNGVDPKQFSIPQSSNRPKTGIKGGGQGDHIIAYNLILNHLLVVRNQNIKTLPKIFKELIEAVLPEDLDLKKQLDDLAIEIDKDRKIRKDATTALRISFDKSKLEKIKNNLIGGQQRKIRDSIEKIAGDFVEIINQKEDAAQAKSRKENSNYESKQKKPGAGEKIAVNKLENINDNFYIKKLPLLEDISQCMFDLYDYPKTGKKDEDNLEILSTTIARLTVLTFTIFPNLKKLTTDNKEAIYDKFLDLVLENQCWKEHEITVDDRTKNLDQVELKELINKIAELDFANDKFKMKPLIPPKSISPTSIQSLNKKSKAR